MNRLAEEEEVAAAVGWGEEARAVEREKALAYTKYEELKREHDATDRYDQVRTYVGLGWVPCVLGSHTTQSLRHRLTVKTNQPTNQTKQMPLALALCERYPELVASALRARWPHVLLDDAHALSPLLLRSVRPSLRLSFFLI